MCKICVLTPELYFGEAMGGLCKFGAWVEDVSKQQQGKLRITARIPSNERVRFSDWLAKETSGEAGCENVT
jgi:translation elongation factor EF-G